MTIRHLAVPAYTVPAVGAGVAFRSKDQTTYASRTNTAIPAPAGIVNGDQLLFTIFTGSSGTPPTATPPAGLTQIGTQTTNTQGGFTSKFAVYRKTASGESGSYTFSHTSASSQGVCLCYSGVNTTTPQDVTATQNTWNGSNGKIATATGLTTTTNSSMIVYLEHNWGDNVAADPPTGMTERLEVVLTYVADVIQASAGATGNKTHDCSNANNSVPWTAFLVALRPA